MAKKRGLLLAFGVFLAISVGVVVFGSREPGSVRYIEGLERAVGYAYEETSGGTREEATFRLTLAEHAQFELLLAGDVAEGRLKPDRQTQRIDDLPVKILRHEPYRFTIAVRDEDSERPVRVTVLRRYQPGPLEIASRWVRGALGLA